MTIEACQGPLSPESITIAHCAAARAKTWNRATENDSFAQIVYIPYRKTMGSRRLHDVSRSRSVDNGSGTLWRHGSTTCHSTLCSQWPLTDQGRNVYPSTDPYTYCTSQPVHNVDLRHYGTGLLRPLCNSTNVVQLLHVCTFTRAAGVVEVEASRFVHPPETRCFRSFGIDDSKSVRLTSISGVDMVLAW
ncbi:hypothetical protein BR93DRAFT_330962 [Coniochaeta sp. PMI_546]|nr:hypothetical protein BR93DRAFT_330962 [Coniochaeta sp. PMI_546]